MATKESVARRHHEAEDADVVEQRLLLELVDRAGELQQQNTAIRKAYDKTRADLEALLKKRHGAGIRVEGERFAAEIGVVQERTIDPRKLYHLVKTAVFFRLVRVLVGETEHELEPRDFARVCEVGSVQRLKITARDVGRGE